MALGGSCLTSESLEGRLIDAEDEREEEVGLGEAVGEEARRRHFFGKVL